MCLKMSNYVEPGAVRGKAHFQLETLHLQYILKYRKDTPMFSSDMPNKTDRQTYKPKPLTLYKKFGKC